MEENNNIDDLFRSAIEPFEMAPSAKGKEKLLAELGKKRKAGNFKRGLGFFSVSIVLLFVGYTAYHFLNSASSKKNVPVEVSTKNFSASSSNPNVELKPTEQKESENLTTTKNPDKNNVVASINNNAENVDKTTFESAVDPTVNPHVSMKKSRKLPVTNALHKESSIKPTASLNKTKAAPTTSALIIADATKKETLLSENKLSKENTSSTDKHANMVGLIPAVNPNQQEIFTINTINNQSNSTPVHIEKTATASEKQTEASVTGKDNVAITNENPTQDVHSVNKLTDVASPLPASGNANANTSLEDKKIQNIPEDNLANENFTPTNVLIGNEVKAENPIVENTINNRVSSDSSTTTNKQPESISPVAEIPFADAPASLMKKILSHISAEMYFSPDYVSNRYKTNYTYSGSASKNPDDYSDQKPEFSYSTGFRLGYDIVKKWSLVSGISFSTFSQSAVYNSVSVISDSVYKEVHNWHGPGHGNPHSGGGHNHQPPNSNNGHHYVIHTPCGDIDLHNEPPRPFGSPEPQNGDALSIKTEVSETIHFIYVPLLVRYNFGNKKFSYIVEGGGAVNIVSKDIINVYINDAFQETNNLDGLKQLNYSLLFGAGVQYNFYKGLSTFIKPSFRYTITPMNQNNPIYSYPYYIGIGAGFSIHF